MLEDAISGSLSTLRSKNSYGKTPENNRLTAAFQTRLRGALNAYT